MVIQSVSTYETSSNSPSFTFAPAIPIVGYTIIKHQNQMQVLEEIKVSVYENVYSKKPKIMSFLEVIFMCIHPVYASIIQSIRRYHQEGDHEAAQKLKSQLPCFTPAGTFDGAHAIRNFQLPSHIIGLDYDHVPNRLEIIRLCAADPHTVAALESPTDGVKIFAYVEGIEGHHREGQLLVSRYYDQLTGLTSDPACKDESRLCYFTYSPDGYVASLYQSFVLEAAVETQPFQPTAENLPSPPLPAKANETSENFSEEEVNLFLSSYIFLNPLTAGQRHTNLFKLACEACRRRYSQESILRGITVYFEHSDFPAQEIRSILQSGYQKVTSTPSVSASPLCSSLHKDKMTKVTYSPSENIYEADEAYWQGEEFRKETPCFPKSVYKYLPDLLNECILEEEGDREQDLSFLSNLTALSSVLPGTFGIYNHKKYSPHFYSFGIAPPGATRALRKQDVICWKKSTTGYFPIANFSRKFITISTPNGNWTVLIRKRHMKSVPKSRKNQLTKCFFSLPLPATAVCRSKCGTTVRKEASYSIPRRRRWLQPIIWIAVTLTICSARHSSMRISIPLSRSMV